MSQKSSMKKSPSGKKTLKSVSFNKQKTVRKYEQNYSDERILNTQTPQEYRRAKTEAMEEAREEARIKRNSTKSKDINPEDTIQITRGPKTTISVKKSKPSLKNQGAWHKFKKMTGMIKSTKGGRRTKRIQNKRTRKTKK